MNDISMAAFRSKFSHSFLSFARCDLRFAIGRHNFNLFFFFAHQIRPFIFGFINYVQKLRSIAQFPFSEPSFVTLIHRFKLLHCKQMKISIYENLFDVFILLLLHFLVLHSIGHFILAQPGLQSRTETKKMCFSLFVFCL